MHTTQARYTRAFLCALLLGFLAACGGGGGGGGASSEQATSFREDWTLEFAMKMAEHPLAAQGALFAIDLPHPTADAGSLHYVTMEAPGDLSGYSRIVMTYRIDAEPGVKIVPRRFPDAPSMLTLYFQRTGDTMTARGPYEAYRWYASFSTQTPITAGEHRIEAPLDANWTAVLGSSRQNNPDAFREAMKAAGRVGFVVGGGDGLGHGIYATGPARLVVTSFTLE